jgi:hypothetical protein
MEAGGGSSYGACQRTMKDGDGQWGLLQGVNDGILD